MANALMMPDIAGAFAQGQAARALRQEGDRQNALREFLAENGGALMAGDQNALAGFAQYDPMGALNIQGRQQEMEQSRQRFGLLQQQTRQGMAIDAERLRIAQAQGERAATEFGWQVDDRKRAELAEKAKSDAEQAQIAWSGGAEEFDRWNDGHPEYANISYEDAPYKIAEALGAAAVLESMKPAEPIRARTGDVFLDPETMQPLTSVPEPGFRDATPEELSRYGAPAGQVGPNGQFHAINPPGGMTVFGPDGKPIVQTGRGHGALTEGQSKDNYYLTAVQHARDVDDYESALTGVGAAGNAVAGAVPLVGGFAQSEAYQMGQVAAREWGAAILRKESGAALTASDMEWLETRFIPVPSDKPGTVARKRAARRAAEAGLKSGMSQSQIESVANAIIEAGETPAAPREGEESIDDILGRY